MQAKYWNHFPENLQFVMFYRACKLATVTKGPELSEESMLQTLSGMNINPAVLYHRKQITNGSILRKKQTLEAEMYFSDNCLTF